MHRNKAKNVLEDGESVETATFAIQRSSSLRTENSPLDLAHGGFPGTSLIILELA